MDSNNPYSATVPAAGGLGANASSATPEYIQCPHPNDVLFPVSSFQLWAGNCKYINAVNARKHDFSKHENKPLERAQLACEVVQIVQEQNPPGRFLKAIEIPVAYSADVPANANIVGTTVWKPLQEPQVMVQLGEHLLESKKEKKRRKKLDHMRKKKKRQKEEEEKATTIPISKMGELQCLYYVPTPEMNSSGTPEEAESSSSSDESSSSSEEEKAPPPAPAPKPKKLRAAPKPRPVSTHSSTSKAKKAPPPKVVSSRVAFPVQLQLSSKPHKPAAKSQKAAPPKKTKPDYAAAQVAIQEMNAANGGHNDKAAKLAAAISRGVTMRPSGKWQAQMYFAGKSRYIGVFDSREKAALAYEIARELLKNGLPPGESDGKTTENLVNAARKAAFDGVGEKFV